MRVLFLTVFSLLAATNGGLAEDVRILSAAAMKAPLVEAQEKAPDATGSGILLDLGTAGGVADKLAAGARADLVILPPGRLDELAARGLVMAGHADLGTVQLGLAVRRGAPHPAVATEADVRTALQQALSIGLADPASGATTGIFFTGLLKHMGLDETLRPKIKLFPDGTAAMEALARGDVALAAGQISEIKPVAGVDLVGPLPDALQLRTVYAAAVTRNAASPDAARAMVGFLTSAKMAPALAAAGFDLPSTSKVLAAPKLDSRQGDYIAHNFRFHSGQTLPDLKLHYTTLGVPRTDAAGHVTNAVLTLHGTTGTGRNFLAPSIAGVLFGPGQPLDASKYFIIMPDGIGRGGSSKPSDGLRTSFPHYGYVDLVEAQHALVVDGLHIDHLRLVLGTSMGGMHAWLWGERYPAMMDAIMPVASQPVAVTGRNYLWRNLIIQSIRGDPDWHNGDYAKEPTHFETVLPIFTIMTGSPRVLEAAAPTEAKGDAYFNKLVADATTSVDANDYLYWFEAVSDYDPEQDLDKIVAPLFAVNFADDLLNPVQLGTMSRVMPRVKNGRYVIVPEGPDTIGHQSLTQAKLWAPYLEQLMRDSQRTPN